MIISVSRRTDIPAFYSDWFYERIKEKYVLVRNPLNIHQISKINLSPDVVDFIVFWTKNPQKMLARINELEDYNYYFQFTLTAYDNDIEENVPSKGKYIISTFKKLSDIIGKERVIWRYDPILLNDKYNVSYHFKNFEKLAKILSDYTEKCTISFLDMYQKTERNLKGNNIEQFDDAKIRYIAKTLSEIAKSYNLKMDTCSEKIDLQEYGITHAHCIDGELMERISKCPLKLKKDKNQRKECGCMESIDIGAYNTCKNGCKYCYANFNNNQVLNNCALHKLQSGLIYGDIDNNIDKITVRKMKSLKQKKINDKQLNLFN